MSTARRTPGLVVAVVAFATVAALAGCSSNHPNPASSPGVSAAPSEVSPSGDIPDTQVYVPFTMPDGTFIVSVPEGWARSTDGNATVFTDKTNTVRLESKAQPTAPTVDSVKSEVLPAITVNTPGYSVSVVQRKAGPAVLATYQTTSALNPVTGKAVTDDVQLYAFWHAGHSAVITLSASVGADNADPWNTITNSLQWK